MKIILATKNQGKLKEFEVLARNTDLEFETLPDHITELPEETGSTFKENALIKAEYAFKNCGGVACLADDSGLEVDFLNGEPGIFSSRYSEEGTDESNMEKLLHELKEAEDSQRSARFKCSLMLLTNDNDYFAEGSFEEGDGQGLDGLQPFVKGAFRHGGRVFHEFELKAILRDERFIDVAADKSN